MKNVLYHEILHQKHFEEMTRIPHGSGNEKAYSDYLAGWAAARGLSYVQDEIGNVIIYKAASAGYEDHAPVLLQAHMDMVCNAVPESTHDFTKDPLELYVEEDWLKTRGTTLGADDGVGIAYMLALLEDDTLCHPPLECVFTVQEEVGCNGAAALKKEYFQARRMIAMDDVGGGTSYVTTAGCHLMRFSRPVSMEPSAGPVYELDIRGLLGGHSGVDIEKERGNAVELAVRTLYGLLEEGGLQLIWADLGAATNVIADSGKIAFTTELDPEQVKDHVAAMEARFRKELEFSDAGLVMTLTCGESLGQAVCIEDTREILQFFRLLKTGMQHMSMRFEGLTMASANMGTLKLKDGQMTADYSTRSALTSYLESLAEEQTLLCRLFHMKRQVLARVAAFDYIENSPIRKELEQAFTEVTGRALQPIFVHGAIEAAYFKELYPEMDIVTIGPLVVDEHMPTERLSLKSFDEIWEVLKNLLARL